jgi:deoxycytidylate deaminase
MKSRDIKKYEFNIGAIVVDKKGQILSMGFNSYTKTHPIQYLYNKDIRKNRIYLHAEISSLVKCSTLNSAAHMMIVARLGRDGKIHLAKPCEGCYRAIVDSHIKHVYYTNDYGELVLMNTENNKLYERVFN